MAITLRRFHCMIYAVTVFVRGHKMPHRGKEFDVQILRAVVHYQIDESGSTKPELEQDILVRDKDTWRYFHIVDTA